MKDGPSPKSLSTSVTVEPLDDDIDVNVNGRNNDQQPSTSIGLLRQVRHSGNDLDTKSNSNGDLNSVELKQLNNSNNRVRQIDKKNIFFKSLRKKKWINGFCGEICYFFVLCSKENCYFVNTKKKNYTQKDIMCQI